MPAASPAPTSSATDARGTTHPVEFANPRIVSLVPSLTELLFALGLGANVIGRTGFCIHPKSEVGAIPKVGGTKTVNIARIRRLSPTHVIVNIDENTLETVEALEAFVPHIVVTHPLTVADNLVVFRLFGALFGRKAESDRLAAELGERLLARERESYQRRLVLYVIWKDPWMTVSAKTYIADILQKAGMIQIASPDPDRYPKIDIRAAARAAEAVLLSSEPYPFREAERRTLSAEIGKPVLCVDGEMLSWYGSRAIAGLDYVATVKTALEAALGHYRT